MSKKTIDDILVYAQLSRRDQTQVQEQKKPERTLDDLQEYLDEALHDQPGLSRMIENLPERIREGLSRNMLEKGKSFEYIASSLEEEAHRYAQRDALRDARSASAEAAATMQELGWDDRTAERVGRTAGRTAFHNAFETDHIGRDDGAGHDVAEDGVIAAIKFHLDIPADGISLYEAYESMVITDDWSDGQVQEIDVVRHLQELESGQEPSQTGFAIEFAAKLRAAIDEGADPDMPLSEALEWGSSSEVFGPPTSSLSPEQIDRIRARLDEVNDSKEAINEETVGHTAVTPPPAFDM